MTPFRCSTLRVGQQQGGAQGLTVRADLEDALAARLRLRYQVARGIKREMRTSTTGTTRLAPSGEVSSGPSNLATGRAQWRVLLDQWHGRGGDSATKAGPAERGRVIPISVA